MDRRRRGKLTRNQQKRSSGASGDSCKEAPGSQGSKGYSKITPDNNLCLFRSLYKNEIRLPFSVREILVEEESRNRLK